MCRNDGGGGESTSSSGDEHLIKSNGFMKNSIFFMQLKRLKSTKLYPIYPDRERELLRERDFVHESL